MLIKNTYKYALTIALSSLLFACSGGGSSSGGGSVKATECLSIKNNFFVNSCAFDINVRGASFIEQSDIVTLVPAMNQTPFRGGSIFGSEFYACKAPFKPWIIVDILEDTKVSCFDPAKFPDA